MKTKLILILLSCCLSSLSAQDTIIETANFTLEIRRINAFSEPSQSIKTNDNFQTIEFHWLNISIDQIVKKWMEFIELESIDYRIEGKLGEAIDYFSFIDTAQFRADMNRGDTSILLRDYLTVGDSTLIFTGFDVKLTNKFKDGVSSKQVEKESFEAFISFMGIDFQTVVEEKTFWMLHIVDLPNATISPNQDKFWKRTDFENYTYYETISFRRIADLLGRKLEAFVRPIPYDTYKFDIKIPKSDASIDLQYAMQEHGLELIQVTEVIEIFVIKEIANPKPE